MGTVLILIGVGALLMVIETILPGLIVGLAGLGCVVAGVAAAYINLDSSTAHWVLLGTLVGLTAGAVAWFQWFPRSAVARPFLSRGQVGEIGADHPEFLGLEGRSLTALRPSGMARIDGKRVDVVADGGAYIEPGCRIRVAAVEGMRVVVRACDPSTESATEPRF